MTTPVDALGRLHVTDEINASDGFPRCFFHLSRLRLSVNTIRSSFRTIATSPAVQCERKLFPRCHHRYCRSTDQKSRRGTVRIHSENKFLRFTNENDRAQTRNDFYQTFVLQRIVTLNAQHDTCCRIRVFTCLHVEPAARSIPFRALVFRLGKLIVFLSDTILKSKIVTLITNFSIKQKKNAGPSQVLVQVRRTGSAHWRLQNRARVPGR